MVHIKRLFFDEIWTLKIVKLYTHLLVVELTEVLLFDLLDMIESPQLTTVPLLMEKVRNR